MLGRPLGECAGTPGLETRPATIRDGGRVDLLADQRDVSVFRFGECFADALTRKVLTERPNTQKKPTVTDGPRFVVSVRRGRC